MKNIFSLVIEKSAGAAGEGQASFSRSTLYAAVGFLLGVSAPVGWLILRLILFFDSGAGIWSQTVGHMLQDGQHLALFAYMGGGTAVVLGLFGYFIGRAAEQIHLRAARLNEMNQTFSRQKE